MSAYLQSRSHCSFKRSRRSGKSPGSGFSLIELILGLGLAAVMGVSVFMVYANAVRLDAYSKGLSENIFRTFMTFKVIENDLGRVASYRYRVQGSDSEEFAFVGQEGRLAFVARTPHGLNWVEYFTQEDAQQAIVQSTALGRRYERNTDQTLERAVSEQKGQRLMRQEIAFNGMPPAGDVKDEAQVLTRGIAAGGMTFYYGKVSGNSGLVWSDSWEGSTLPAAIRVEARMRNDRSGRMSQYSKVVLLPVGF